MSRTSSVVGRYIYLDVDGQEYRVYYEEAGSGIPVLMQHTAGADGRQWRHQLEDPELTRDFRLIAYDLPFHGKSLPPTDSRWWEEEYRLTQDFFTKFIVAMSHALELDNPVYLGCSVGGTLAPVLALHYPDEFRAVIGCESTAKMPGFFVDYWDHPRISNEGKGAMMLGIQSPKVPEVNTRENDYLFRQCELRVLKGDLYYYSIEHDLTETAGDIDTSRIPVYILNGEWDLATPAAEGRAIAEKIPGAKFTELKGLGHFPMNEDPELFKSYLVPVLEEIKAKASVGSLR
ncbi:alpha/beta hydrolase [Streptomyces sp. NPDC026672]|uniref:alpha/beta fold hydrolase n=1 Tax=unclassified Streptomyces TaxID=2593676 RepID=UPI0033F82956